MYDPTWFYTFAILDVYVTFSVSMSKKLLGVIALMMVVGALGYLWLLSRTPTATGIPVEPVATSTSGATLPPEIPLSGRGPLRELFNTGRNLECQVWQGSSDSSPEMEGSVFLSSGKLRGDFIASVNGTTTVTSLIMADGRLYTWSIIDGRGYGVEVPMSDGVASSTVDVRAPLTLDQSVRFACKAWGNIDKSIFTPPTDVLFRDMNTIVEQGMEYGTTY